MTATKIERALVTGATGFVGSALVARLAAQGIPVTGLSRHGGSGSMVADVRRFAEVRRALEETRPTHLFHLAGDHPSQVAEAADLASSLELNAGGAANVVAAAAE